MDPEWCTAPPLSSRSRHPCRASWSDAALLPHPRAGRRPSTDKGEAAGEARWEGAAHAWGKKLAGYSPLAAPRHGFVGAEPDEAVGTYSFGARTYDPTLRRWVSPDPLLIGQPDLDEHSGAALNLYGYADGNPVKNTDKSGFCPGCKEVAAAAIVGGFVQAIAYAATAPTNLTAGQFALGAARSFSHGAWEGAAAGATALVAEVVAVKAIGAVVRVASTEAAVAKTAQTVAKAEAAAVTAPAKGTGGVEAAAGGRATGVLGSRGAPLANASYQPLRNVDAVIGGRTFGGHALDQMQNRGLMPSVVENAIENGVRSADPIVGRFRFFDAVNNVTVITEGEAAGRIITVIPGGR